MELMVIFKGKHIKVIYQKGCNILKKEQSQQNLRISNILSATKQFQENMAYI